MPPRVLIVRSHAEIIECVRKLRAEVEKQSRREPWEEYVDATYEEGAVAFYEWLTNPAAPYPEQ